MDGEKGRKREKEREREREEGEFSVYDNDWHQQRASASSTFVALRSLMYAAGGKGETGRDEEAKGTRKGAKQRVLYVKTISTIKITAGDLDNPRVNLEGL